MESDRWSSSSGTVMISETRATSEFRSEKIVRSDTEWDVTVTAIEQSDSEETEIAVSRDILGARPAGGLALAQSLSLITCVSEQKMSKRLNITASET